jgi:hypothetical protein
MDFKLTLRVYYGDAVSNDGAGNSFFSPENYQSVPPVPPGYTIISIDGELPDDADEPERAVRKECVVRADGWLADATAFYLANPWDNGPLNDRTAGTPEAFFADCLKRHFRCEVPKDENVYQALLCIRKLSRFLEPREGRAIFTTVDDVERAAIEHIKPRAAFKPLIWFVLRHLKPEGTAIYRPH